MGRINGSDQIREAGQQQAAQDASQIVSRGTQTFTPVEQGAAPAAPISYSGGVVNESTHEQEPVQTETKRVEHKGEKPHGQRAAQTQLGPSVVPVQETTEEEGATEAGAQALEPHVATQAAGNDLVGAYAEGVAQRQQRERNANLLSDNIAVKTEAARKGYKARREERAKKAEEDRLARIKRANVESGAAQPTPGKIPQKINPENPTVRQRVDAVRGDYNSLPRPLYGTATNPAPEAGVEEPIGEEYGPEQIPEFQSFRPSREFVYDMTNEEDIAEVESMKNDPYEQIWSKWRPEIYESDESEIPEEAAVTDWNKRSMEEIENEQERLQASSEYEAFIKSEFVKPIMVENQELREFGQPGHFIVGYDPEIELALAHFAKRMGLDTIKDHVLLHQMIRLNMAYSPDNGARNFNDNEPFDDPEGGQELWTGVYEQEILNTLRRMERSMDIYGHPFGYTDLTAHLYVGKNPRFPIAVPSPQIVDILARANNTTTDQILRNCQKQATVTLGKVHDNARITGQRYQLEAYKAQVRAYCDMFGYDPEAFGVSPRIGQSLDEIYAEEDAAADFIGGNYREYSQERKERARKQTIARSIKGSHKRDEGREYNNSEQFMQDAMSIARSAGIAGNIPLIATSAAEFGVANLEAKATNAIMFAGIDQRFHMTAELREASKSEDMQDALRGAMLLQQIGGNDMIIEYLEDETHVLSEEAVKKWITEISPNYPHPRAHEWISKLNKITDVMMYGNWSTKMESMRWTEAFLLQMAETRGMTAAQVARNMQDDPQRFMSDAFRHPAGYQALVSMVPTSVSMISPVSELVNRAIKNSGMSDATISTLLGSKYLQYGIKQIELWIPYSKTIGYALWSKGKSGATTPGEVIGGIISNEQIANAFTDMNENQINSLKRCLILDTLKFGRNLFSGAVAYAIVAALMGGFKPPEDPKKRLLPWEWRVKDAKGNWVPFDQGWFMDDLLQWQMPWMTVLALLNNGGSAEDAVQMMKNGVAHFLATNKILQFGEDLVNLPFFLDKLNKGETTMSDEVIKFVCKRLNMYTNMMGVTQFTEDAHNGDFERNATRMADGSFRTNKFDRTLNMYTLNNPLLELMANIGHGLTHGGDFSHYGWANTGLDYDEDEILKACADHWDSVSADDIIDKWISVDGNLEEFIDDPDYPLMLSKSKAKEVKDRIRERIDELQDTINDATLSKARGEINYNTQQLIVSPAYKEKDQLWDVFYALGYKGLVYDEQAYKIEVGTHQFNPETGEYYNYGDETSNWNIFDSMWFRPETKTEDVQFRNPGAGYDQDNGNFGDFHTESLRNDNTPAPYRHDIPNTDSDFILGLQSDYEEAKAAIKASEDETKEQASKLASSGNTTYRNNGGGGSSYSSKNYSSGGTSSNYSPKIYNMKGGSLSVNKPATMYTKTPYSANKSYLSPDFQTAGSRNAYKRSEY